MEQLLISIYARLALLAYVILREGLTKIYVPFVGHAEVSSCRSLWLYLAPLHARDVQQPRLWYGGCFRAHQLVSAASFGFPNDRGAILSARGLTLLPGTAA